MDDIEATDTDPSRKQPEKGSVHTKNFSGTTPKEVDLSGQTVGGYEVKSMLGAGGMGAVCLARQKSLDRDVALKILPGRFAQNPDFLVRFTREALSAAQLTHHNIIQVYDVGNDSDVHYISMEFVRGDSLADMIRRDGPLNHEDAAGYVLQAARGLKYAHERGIIHRDIKPDNLMLNEHGIVKVADLGLAKMRGQKEENRSAPDPTLMAKARGDLTMAEVAMGTPAYMPPEQARDATNVDARADQYSLGCTLYYLCAGKPPYSGSTAMEIITKHKEAPLPSLEEARRSVPGALNTVLTRMLAKEPEGRYADMGDLIEDLEAVLGVDSEKGPYTPREQHLKILETAQSDYYSAPYGRWKKVAVAGFFVFTLALFVMSAVNQSFGLAGFFLGLLLLTPLANFVTDGLFHKTYLFRRVRSVFFHMPLTGWLKAIAGTAVLIAVLFAVGLLPWWVGAALTAAGLAALYQGFLVARLRAQREEPLEQVRNMLKHLRLRGLSEEALQNFICRFSEEHWEELSLIHI